ncbi:MAG: recombination protein RecR [Candidatus Omnitrophica bacterium CG07_land_8_20_14_0_80_42_15]|uniref:Recombination protein RecR n=1 Tax=Candidatus Aquitaenariimonas noxiae TaxID=1974741 RepID=A0A2J0KTZ6_9BACT|nr:MAG: recombination protein RecR [Candidatus Omnitrophica bacterium CG07_land_8_20_14_0_80_42_15]PIV39174.1 MAG: recombination protein RecR [Candidatus Omnitrophica bacterium CG02_land_8_20_14_3_00__42_8]
MSGYTESMRKLIEEFSKMPGIGPKTAERLALYILKVNKETAKALSDSILKIKEATRFCANCNNLSEAELCDICRDTRRDRSVICIVEDPGDIASIEKTGSFRGVYHVLLGTLSPLDGIGPEDLKINELIDRIKKGGVKEAIIATNPDTEGETTALYLTKLMKPLSVKVTKIASGVPMGSSLEYIDQASLTKAIEGRHQV